MDTKDTVLKVSVIISFILMLFLNASSFLLAINGKTMSEVSISYPNLFTPANYTFSIWSMIYLLLMIYAIFQLGIFGNVSTVKDTLHKSRIAFIITSLLNCSWIIAWHYDYLAFSVMIIMTILVTLKIFSKMIRADYLTIKEKIFIRLPFSIYYGWITILAVSNILALLDSIRWEGWGISEISWVVINIVIITAFAVYRTIRNRDIAYSFTIIWAYIGMLVRQLAKSELNGEYPLAITAIIVGIIALSISNCYLIITRRKK